MVNEWDECLRESNAWLLKPLKQKLQYEKPLPVQQAIIPSVQRALLGGFPMDMCLTAPTGSGKTLCYLLPMLSLVAECKKGVDHTRLRALILVPTKALGMQVFDEVLQLTRGTSIAVESLCKADVSVKEEAEAIVRSAIVVNNTPLVNDLEKIDMDKYDDNKYDELSSSDMTRALSQLCYYSCVDILISTPQRLLRHLDSTRGLSLSDLRLLVIDEADQVLAGNFANFVSKVVERFEEEQMQKLGDVGGRRRLVQLTYSLHKMLCSATLSSHIARIFEVRLRNCRYFVLDSFGSDIRRDDEGDPLTLKQEQPRKGKKRRPTRDQKEEEEEEEEEEEKDPAAVLPISRRQLVHTSFALPPRLQEHVVFVEDWYRHAVLLKLIRMIISRLNGDNLSRTIEKKENMLSVDGNKNKNDRKGDVTDNNNNNINNEEKKKEEDDNDDDDDEREGDDAEFRVIGYRRRQQEQRESISRKVTSSSFSFSSDDYPSCDDDAGRRILVFCRTAEEARVMGHFLLSAGVQAIEFTTLTTESERRRALIKSSSNACIVASDALMRGVNVPNIGHVIMYNPPETLSQYVHRAGRTARAMRAGHLHLLLQKNGPSGTQRDGEVAVFKALSAAIARTQPIRYERHFFMFERPPTNATHMNNNNNNSGGSGSHSEGNSKETLTTDKTRLLINEADEYLKKTQARLSAHWASALECNKKTDRHSMKELTSNSIHTSRETPAKKERR